MSTIWIVEDDAKIALLIDMTVRKLGHDTLCLSDAEALERQRRKGTGLPDLLLLDLMLRATSGFDVLREWKTDRVTRRVPIIIISARGAERDKVQGLDGGAEDYITKPFGVRELQARVQAALRRVPAAPPQLDFGALVLRTESRETLVDGRRVDLTAMEYELLLYLARRPGTAVTRQELLREVWGYNSQDDASRTVDSHVKTLRLKLGDTADTPRFIQTVRGTGYRLIAGEKP